MAEAIEVYPDGRSPVLRRARAVVPPLRVAFRGLLEAIPKAQARRRGVPGLHATLASRLRRGAETESVPASLFHLPGPDGLRRALKALRKFNPDPPLLAEAERCIDRYDEFLRDEGLTLDALQAMLAQYLPEAREDVLTRNAQVVFSGMRNLCGCSADAQIVTYIVFPGATADDHDEIVMQGFVGWERLRADAWPHVIGYRIYDADDANGPTNFTVDGVAITGRGDALLPEYCDGPIPVFQRFGDDATDVLYVAGAEVGVRSACTFFLAEHFRNALSAAPSERARLRSFNVVPRIPLRRLLVDVLLHDDVWPGRYPTVETYRTSPEGRVHEPDRRRRHWDRLELGGSIASLARGLPAIETSAYGDYSRLVHSTLRRLKQPADRFRGYRLDVTYPVHAVQYSMSLDLGDPR